MLLRALIFLCNRPRRREVSECERERERNWRSERRESTRHLHPDLSGARVCLRAYARNTCGGKTVSSFRALSFASRVLDEKKKRTTRVRGGKRGESAKGEKRSLSLSFSIGTTEATRALSPKGAFFRRLEKEERKRRRTGDGRGTTDRG